MSKRTYGPWQTINQCHVCGNMSEYVHKVSPCQTCGENNYGNYTVRFVSYSWIAKLIARLTGQPLLQDRWDYKIKVPPIPKRNEHVPQSRIDQLQLQQDLIELLPDEFDIYLEDDKVLVKRLAKPQTDSAFIRNIRKMAGFP